MFHCEHKSCVCTGPLSLANAISHFGSKITIASTKLDRLLQSDNSASKGRTYWCVAPDSKDYISALPANKKRDEEI
jgi:hypothetical protein